MSSNKKDIGNLNNKEFGCELDPDKKLKLVRDDNKGQQAYYKGKKMNYMDYYSELDDRIRKKKQGKSITNMGMFSGVNFDKNGKIIK